MLKSVFRAVSAAILTSLIIAIPPEATQAQTEPTLTITDPQLDAPVILSRTDLMALPRTEYVTTTIWTEGPQRFSGVSLHDLMDHLKIEAEILEFKAINDYSITVPVSEIGQDNPMIAYARNGEPMSLREKGPFWLVYNYDFDPAFRTETVYSRSIWQLDRITAR
ncbi:Oxidoreductase molybdopterin binding domain protein [Roseovarius tolerans]|uniref:Oxidoreductase molybdopterin binding domain protein n=1 Tax=Roseovarius tolerans TaxID=74031 RepID=A0A0L6CYF0_9RHOB|nr:molybdopterin-dependent oxidoreductase [Roseovarius tolerans]KNX42827.1 Oxidoreductase molybdopterin binding domain protein [Roseovarius tolerans]